MLVTKSDYCKTPCTCAIEAQITMHSTYIYNDTLADQNFKFIVDSLFELEAGNNSMMAS